MGKTDTESEGVNSPKPPSDEEVVSDRLPYEMRLSSINITLDVEMPRTGHKGELPFWIARLMIRNGTATWWENEIHLRDYLDDARVLSLNKVLSNVDLSELEKALVNISLRVREGLVEEGVRSNRVKRGD